jgi:diguanylate cyclase (GGDEF)-like protein
VLPAWYQTRQWKLGLAAGALAGVSALLQGRTAYLRRRQLELEAQVAQRTAELEESKRHVELLAYRDALTGLPNRRQFMADMMKSLTLAHRKNRRFALLLIDLDRFKQINDSLGHDAGDALLVEAARRLGLAVRLSNSIARLGGDEFAILIGDLSANAVIDRHTVETVCTRVVGAFIEPIAFGTLSIKTSASVGVALCPEHGDDSETLYKAADLALYEAKHAGRDKWRWHQAPPPQVELR